MPVHSSRQRHHQRPLPSTPNNSDNENKPTDDNYDWLWLVCLPLWLVYVSNLWSRFSFNYLVDFSPTATAFHAINVDLQFNQAQYGVLASVAFTSLFAIASLGAGIASDRSNRKYLTLVSCLGWIAATVGTALAHDFNQVAMARIVMGLACAFSTPTAYTLLKDKVPYQRQALASSLYGTGVAVASGLSSLTILIDNAEQVGGWRNSCLFIALYGGIALIVCALVLPNDDAKHAETTTTTTTTPTSVSNNIPKDATSEPTTSSSILSDVADTVSTTRAQWLLLASFLRFCSGLCIGVWGAPYFRLEFPDQQASYSVVQASISAIGASVSGLVGGATADYLSTTTASSDGSTTDAVGRRLWVPVAGSLLAAPAWYFAVQTDQSFETAMAWLAAEYLVAECWFGPTISTLQATVRPGTGGTAQGLFTLTGAVANLVPAGLGYIYGQSTNAANAEELSSLLVAAVCFGYLSCAVCFAMAAQSPPPAPAVAVDNKPKQA